MPRRFVSLSLLFLLACIPVACMGDDDTDSADIDVSAEEALQTAREAWDATETAHFVLEIDGDAYLDEGESIKLESGEGDIKRPGSVKAEASVDAGISVVDIRLVAVEGEIFITNLLTGNWERAPQDFSYDPSILFSDTDGIGPIMTDLQNAEVDGTESIDGVEAYKITGTVTAERVSAITAGSIEGDEIDITLWTQVEDGKLLRVVLTEPDGVRDSPATWNLTMSGHGNPVEIDAPQISMRAR